MAANDSGSTPLAAPWRQSLRGLGAQGGRAATRPCGAWAQQRAQRACSAAARPHAHEPTRAAGPACLLAHTVRRANTRAWRGGLSPARNARARCAAPARAGGWVVQPCARAATRPPPRRGAAAARHIACQRPRVQRPRCAAGAGAGGRAGCAPRARARTAAWVSPRASGSLAPAPTGRGSPACAHWTFRWPRTPYYPPAPLLEPRSLARPRKITGRPGRIQTAGRREFLY